MRKGRFKYSRFSEQEFQEILASVNQTSASEFCSIFQVAFGKYRRQEISAAELVAEYLWQILRASSSREYGLKKFQGFTGLEIFLKFNLRGVPAAVSWALNFWRENPAALVLHFSKPTADEMLDFQARGQRVVTIFVDEDGRALSVFDGMGESTDSVHRPCDGLSRSSHLGYHSPPRDPFSFTLHDLIHAHKFFADESLHQSQVEFFKSMQCWLERSDVTDMRINNLQFAQAVDYAASDMNSHPEHMLLYIEHHFKEHLGFFDREDFLRRGQIALLFDEISQPNLQDFEKPQYLLER